MNVPRLLILAFSTPLLAAAVACGGDDSRAAPYDGGPRLDGAGDGTATGEGSLPDGGVPDGAMSPDGTSPDGAPDGAAPDAAAGCTGPFSLQNQQPVSCLPYPGSLWNKPLPADVLSHAAADSDAVVQATFTNNGQFAYPWTRNQALGVVSTATSDGEDPNAPLYYGQATDPVYQIMSCSQSMAPGRNNAIGKTFHAPSAAAFSYEGSDSFLSVWDQTDGLLFSAYVSTSTWEKLPSCPGGGHAGTHADPCPVSFEYCSQSDWSTDPGFGIDGSGDSLGNGGWATHDRGAEMIGGGIRHAQYLETGCTNGHVFPATSNTLACSPTDTNKPAQGALFFLDYTAAQLADIKSQVPLWQYELLEAMTVYGGYVGDTTGGAGGLVIDRHFEGPAAYETANLPYALGDWFLSFPHADSSQSQPLYCFMRTAGQECEFSVYVGVPLETGPACPTTACDVSKHLHLADPCVAMGLAGQPGGCN